MMTDDELEALRAGYVNTLPDLCDIGKRERVSNGMGGGKSEFVADETDVPCRLMPLSQQEKTLAGIDQSASAWRLCLPYGAALSTVQNVRKDGAIYQVHGHDAEQSEAISLNVLVSKVN